MQLGMQVVFLLNFLGFGMALAPACLGSQAVESPALGMLLGFASAPASDFAQVGFHCLWCIRHKVSCEVDWHSGRCQACLLLQFLQGLLHVVDRKSTRLNSSHLGISYAVFCLKKKKTPVTKQH